MNFSRRDFERITGDKDTASILYRHLGYIQGKPESELVSDEAEEEEDEELDEPLSKPGLSQKYVGKHISLFSNQSDTQVCSTHWGKNPQFIQQDWNGFQSQSASTVLLNVCTCEFELWFQIRFEWCSKLIWLEF